ELASLIDVSNITSLTLSSLTDEYSLEFGKYVSLKELNVRCTFISGIGLVNIAKTIGALEVMDISGCENVGSDAADYVRNMGIKVINVKMELNKGKLLRVA